MDTNIHQSKEIIEEAIATYAPHAVVVMVSGGDDSLTALTLCKLLNVPITHIMHGVTRTGVQSTTDHVRTIAQSFNARYIETDAGDTYRNYVTRKGFFGIGHTAHSFAYHQLKHQQFEKALSHHIRKGKPDRRILLVNGARIQESGNRALNFIKPIRPDGTKKPRDKNIWVNIIHYWSKRDCIDLLRDQKMPRCKAALLCHRSGECMCGTMQSKDAAAELAYFFPDWGQWWQSIREEVTNTFSWDWGEDVPQEFKARKERENLIKRGQLDLFDDYLPMCASCQQQNP